MCACSFKQLKKINSKKENCVLPERGTEHKFRGTRNGTEQIFKFSAEHGTGTEQIFKISAERGTGTEQIFKISAERGTGTGQTGKIMPIPGLKSIFGGMQFFRISYLYSMAFYDLASFLINSTNIHIF